MVMDRSDQNAGPIPGRPVRFPTWSGVIHLKSCAFRPGDVESAVRCGWCPYWQRNSWTKIIVISLHCALIIGLLGLALVFFCSRAMFVSYIPLFKMAVPESTWVLFWLNICSALPTSLPSFLPFLTFLPFLPFLLVNSSFWVCCLFVDLDAKTIHSLFFAWPVLDVCTNCFLVRSGIVPQNL